MAIWCKLLFFSLWLSILSAAKLSSKFPSAIVGAEKISISSENIHYRTKYYTQIFDHFNFDPESYQTFQQRYLINDTYWGGARSNSPIFVYTGNEGDIEWFAQNTGGFLYETAPSSSMDRQNEERQFKSKRLGGEENHGIRSHGRNRDVDYSDRERNADPRRSRRETQNDSRTSERGNPDDYSWASERARGDDSRTRERGRRDDRRISESTRNDEQT